MEEKIRIVAYYKWLNAGKPDGKDLDFWLEAEREVDPKNDYTYTKPLSISIRGKNGQVDNIVFVRSWSNLLVKTVRRYVNLYGEAMVRANSKGITFYNFPNLEDPVLIRNLRLVRINGNLFISTKCNANRTYKALKRLSKSFGEDINFNIYQKIPA